MNLKMVGESPPYFSSTVLAVASKNPHKSLPSEIRHQREYDPATYNPSSMREKIGRAVKYWLAIFLGSVASVAALWCTTIPLGIPGEWTWDRAAAEPDLFWNLCGGVVAASLFIGYVLFVRRRLETVFSSPRSRIEVAGWLIGLVAISFAWLWIVQEISPIKNRLGKSAFVLYYPSSSGYYTRARYGEPSSLELLQGYDELMREGDVLHTGTHPPGLFLIFHALIAVCEASPQLSFVLDATQPASFREACDVITTNSQRGRMPRLVVPLDRRVLWLATILVMLSAVLTVIPLFGLLSRETSSANAWTCAAVWPAIPAVAVFVPKSDVLFPLIATTIVWLWLTAWDRRSLWLAFFTGLLTWCGLMCSLAFLPVLLAAGMMTIGFAWLCHFRSGKMSLQNDVSGTPLSSIGTRRWICVVVAGLAFAIPIVVLWCLTDLNMLSIWWLNYRNHAGFYRQYSRTYWIWLLVNPIELSFAAGWPITLLAFITCWQMVCHLRKQDESTSKPKREAVIASIMMVWGLLWLTGKNSGEAARLWVLFLPWMIWLAGIGIDSIITENATINVRQRQAFALLAIQFAVCLLTVVQVHGFHFD